MLFDDPALQALKKTFNAEKVKKEGIVRGTERGFGFLEVANDKNSYFIDPLNMRQVINGDKIVAVITSDDSRNKHQAVPEALVECALKDKFVARVVFVDNKLQVTPNNPSIKQTFVAEDVRPDRTKKLQEGDWVICTLKQHALTNKYFKASITEYITVSQDPKLPWTISLRSLNLPLEAPKSLESYPFLEESFPREDLTAIPFVTIDSEKTEDMDDALYIERCEDGFNLFVAIADPTGYIDENSDLDKEAAKRAFSIYLPGRDIPMLPRELSDNLCSLRENEERNAVVGKIHILNNGHIEYADTEFKLAVIKSHGKLIYNYVSDFYENNDTTNFNPSEQIKGILDLLIEMTKIRDNYRSTELASFRTRPDYDFILTPEGALDHIEINHRRLANQIVEESMIAANLACGDLLAKRLNTGIFNVHMGFDPDYIDDAIELLTKFHYQTTVEELQTIPGFCKARRFCNDQIGSYLDNMIRKYQEYSQITITPGPHYALGVENYATWTSPIRKYGDMINHRLIKSLICDQEHPRMPTEEVLNVMNTARRVNRQAERLVRDWLYVDYLAPEVEKETVFEAELFDVVRSGLRVCLIENGAFVFIPMSLFSADVTKIEFSCESGQVIYEGNQILYRLGDVLQVRLVSVDRVNRSIIAAPVALPLGLELVDIKEATLRRKSNLLGKNGRR